LLVGLFVRLTSEELSGAIIDSLSSFVQASMDYVPHTKGSNDSTKANFLAGQYIQLAVILQLVLTLPLLSVWAIFMKPFVMWLVDSTMISELAYEYTHIVVFAYMVQALSRTLTVVFHICGHEHFESVIDLVAAAMQVIAIACVLVLFDNASLNSVGGIQGKLCVCVCVCVCVF
jgi:Na+-driven multidrug efflux pump